MKPAVFYAFDLLWLNGKDLRQQPLLKRKQRLERLVMSARIPELLYAHHIEEHGVRLFAATRNLAYRSFDKLKAAIAKLRVKDAVLDGDLVCLDASGRSIFNQILYRRSEPARTDEVATHQHGTESIT